MKVRDNSDLDKLLEVFAQEEFKLKDVNCTSKMLNHWEGLNLLLTKRENPEDKRRFSFVEFIWIKLIIEIRKFGVPLPLIQEIKRFFSEENFDPKQHNTASELVDNQEVYRYFAITLAMCVYHHTPTSIRLYKDGSCDIVSAFKRGVPFSGLNLTEPEFTAYDIGSFLSISLSDLIKDYVKNHTFDNISRFKILSNQELLILKLIREHDGIAELSIRYDGKEVSLIEKKEKLSAIQKESRLMDHILKGGYQKISFETQDGQIVNFEKNTKIKI